MKVYDDINTLKRAWDILKECDLEFLLTGISGDLEIDAVKLLDKLLAEDKLVEFMQVITHDNTTSFEDMKLSEVAEIANSFFTTCGAGLGAFLGLRKA